MTGAEAIAGLQQPIGFRRPKRTAKGSEKIKAFGPERIRIIELPPFEIIEADICAEISWRRTFPGETPSMDIRIPQSMLSHFKMETDGTRLLLYSKIPLEKGCRISIRGESLSEIHIAGDANLVCSGMQGPMLIATARGEASMWLSGNIPEVHCESIENATIDAASLECAIIIMESSNNSFVITRTSDAVQAELSGRSTFVTIGCPSVVDIIRDDPAL